MEGTFDFYHFPISQPSRSIHLLLKLVNAPHNVHHVDLISGEHKKPAYLEINPFHTVPFLVHGDFSLSESPAIARYIISNVKCDDHWYPADLKKRARVDEFLSYHHTTIRKAGVRVAFAFYLTGFFTGKKETEEDKQAALKGLDETLAVFESYFLKSGAFIAGDEISIADLFAASEQILQADMSKKDYLASRPKVKEWLERVKEATKPHFEEVFQPFNDFVKTL
ncbi:Glutathione S-transferase theta-1 [Holothuria leucospilota]|uniref:Glutathione S-transferase theta-1 n=1 Tax=Holothuria leucospilota TaxID=206669 RepID=A0A9Q0YKC3_HOLLE|nr:Glutathione S-transferase theta-1 [Holothuria leucospilota]